MANILGINLSELNASEVLERCRRFLASDRPHYLVTPNPEIVLAAHQDEEFFYILNEADLAIADGIGLKLAAWLFGRPIPRVTGADLSLKLLTLAQKEKLRIAVVHWREGLSKQTDISTMLLEKYPDLEALVLDAERDVNQPEIIKKLQEFSPKILFVALGFPYQEKFIHHNLKHLPDLRLALGIGGSFDFMTGKTRRAPRIWRFLGLEWLWRLLTAPRDEYYKHRVRRIYQATLVFLAKVLLVRFIRPFQYRRNVACWLYKPTTEGIKILIVERQDSAGHWQLPQGGTDGETPDVAGARELKEEAGTDKFQAIQTFPNIYRYDFKEVHAYGAMPIRKYINNYRGQKQSLFVARFTGRDEDVKINFWDHRAWRWVDAQNLVAEVHPVRRESAQIFLDKFNSLDTKLD